MKKSHRTLTISLALVLCLALTLTALAEGPLSRLYDAATALLFDTDNASLGIHAVFRYNGQEFKTLDGTYDQDGARSLMDIKLKTPRADGSILESGYTVTAIDGTAYSVEPMLNKRTYQVSNYHTSPSILSSSALRRTIRSLGSAVAAASEGALGDKIAVSAGADGGQTYHVQLKAGDSPALINAAGTLLWQVAAKRFFYMDYDTISEDRDGFGDELFLDIEYDDYDATLETLYQQQFGEPMPEDFYEKLWGEVEADSQKYYTQYSQVSDALYNGLVSQLHETYDRGVALIHPDCTVTYYEKAEDYMISSGNQVLYYDDSSTAFRAWYQQKTGEALSQEDMQAIFMSDNEELWTAYAEMNQQMQDEYLDIVRADGKAFGAKIFNDGSYALLTDYSAYLKDEAYYGYTVKDRILYSMRALELGDTDVTVTLDGQGRFTAAQGTVTVLVIDASGAASPLEVTFEATAGRYGETRVEDFDPAKLGLMSWNEYYDGGYYLEDMPQETPEQPEEPDFELPETVTFNGVEYPVMISQDRG